MKKVKSFNVIEYDTFGKGVKYYDVIPYFENCWNDKKFNFNKKEVKDKESLKQWIERASRYNFWARCEYECLIASWPFGSKAMFNSLKDVLNSDFDFDSYKDTIKLCNTITSDMQKIDVHEQIMMNIDIITDMLYDYFEIK